MIDKNESSLFNLDKLLEQVSEVLRSPLFSDSASLFLLTLWSYFYIAVVDPDEEEGEGGITSVELIAPQIISVQRGYPIFDYGCYLKTSVGKDYGSYTTGRLLTTVKEMVAILKARGAQQVKFSGLAAAERVAWIECEKYNLKTHFKPDTKTKLLESRINNLDKLLSIFKYSI